MKNPKRDINHDRPMYKRSAKQLRGVLSMLTHFVWHRNSRPGDHFWSIPTNPRQDFDCILSDAFQELEDRRHAMAEAGIASRWDERPETD